MEMRYRMVETDRSPPDCRLAVSTCKSSSSLNLTLDSDPQLSKFLLESRMCNRELFELGQHP